MHLWVKRRENLNSLFNLLHIYTFSVSLCSVYDAVYIVSVFAELDQSSSDVMKTNILRYSSNVEQNLEKILPSL